MRKTSDDGSLSDNDSVNQAFSRLQKKTEHVFEIMSNDPLLELLK